MEKFSKNKKLNKVLNTIYDEVMEIGIDNVKRYYNEFKGFKDYNIFSYGNVRVYYDDIRELYKEYKSLSNASDNKLENIYKRQIGYITRYIIKMTIK